MSQTVNRTAFYNPRIARRDVTAIAFNPDNEQVTSVNKYGLEAGRVVGERPPGVEGFLPIAALLSLRHLFTTGEVHPVHPAGLVILSPSSHSPTSKKCARSCGVSSGEWSARYNFRRNHCKLIISYSSSTPERAGLVLGYGRAHA